MRGTAQRAFNTVAGSILWVAGVITLVSGIYVSVTEAPPLPRPVAPMPDIDPSSCMEVLNALGMSTSRDEQAGTIVAKGWPGNVSTLDNLTRISLGVSACKLPMVGFCYKAGCKESPTGFEITLRVAGGGAAARPGAAKPDPKDKPAAAGKSSKPGVPAS